MLIPLVNPPLHLLPLELSIAICPLFVSLRAHGAVRVVPYLFREVDCWQYNICLLHIWCDMLHVKVVVFFDTFHQSIVVADEGGGNVLLVEI